MNHDFYSLFGHFWWLIFPLFWMCAMTAAHWSRHNRANKVLDLLKSYADQGKEPPPELLKALQAQGAMPGGDQDWNRCRGRRSPERRLFGALLFFSLACGFGFLTYYNFNNEDAHHTFGLLVPTLVFAALALSNFIALLWWRDDRPGQDGKTP
jgi:hypothetical protein